MLRFKFDRPEQLQEHLHGVEGRSLLFFRDPGAPLSPGDRVLLELWFANSEQHTFLRGTVVSRVDGHMAGLWLGFPDTRLSRKLGEGAAGLAARRQRRLPTDLLAEVTPAEGFKSMGRLLDVSLGGARLAGCSGLHAGMELDVRLMAPTRDMTPALGRAVVARSHGSDAALRFLRQDGASRMAVTRLFEAVRQQWAAARELSHPPMCCQNGVLLEPPVPRVKAGTTY